MTRRSSEEHVAETADHRSERIPDSEESSLVTSPKIAASVSQPTLTSLYISNDLIASHHARHVGETAASGVHFHMEETGHIGPGQRK